MTTNNAVNVGLSGSTGSGNFVGSTNAVLVTPNIGVATGTSLSLSGQSLFFAYMNSDDSSVTGDGTEVLVPFNATISNVGSSYNTGTYTFTAPATGNYLFVIQVAFGGVTVANTSLGSTLYTSATGRFLGFSANPGPLSLGGGFNELYLPYQSFFVPMNSGNTAQFKVYLGGNGAKNVSISGSSGNDYYRSSMTCYKLP